LVPLLGPLPEQLHKDASQTLWEVAVPRVKSQFSHSHRPKLSGRAGKGQLRPALTRLCGASRGYDRICIGGTQGGARGERRRAGIGNEAAPVWPCGDVGCTRLVIEDGRA
jgi:hypothetical protein